MQYKKLFLGFFSLLVSGTAFAKPFSAPSFKLDGIVLEHAVSHANQASISLKALRDYGKSNDNFNYSSNWDIVCDFSTQEINGAPPPNSSNPLAVIMMGENSVVGDYYTNQGFIVPKGKLEMIVSSMPNDSIGFTSYDTTGDLTISNCVATLRLTGN